jgi:hypothetical protein
MYLMFYLQRGDIVMIKEEPQKPKFHFVAKEKLAAYKDEKIAELIDEAIKVAKKDGCNDIVLPTHIDKALENINIRSRQKKFWKIIATLGGIFLGAFASNYPRVLLEGNKVAIAIYTFMGFVGICIVLLTLDSA